MRGLRISSRARTKDRGTIHNGSWQGMGGFQAQAGISEFDRMTAVYEKVPADFWSRGPNYPCLGLVHPEVLFLELPLRTYFFAQDERSFRVP